VFCENNASKQCKGRWEAARELGIAVVVGASEREGLHIFLNADHTHTLEKAEQVLCEVQFTHRCERRSVDRLELIQHRA
jgi:hypothetical protein